MTLHALLKFICDHPVNRQRKAGALLDFFWWQLRSRLARGPVIYDWINHTQVLVHRGDTGFTCNIYCGLHDFKEMAFLLHYLRPGDVFVDIGANVGSYTLLASAVRQAQAFSFEPIPDTFARLQHNLNLNKLGQRVTAYNQGVGERSGFIRFSKDRNCESHVLRNDEGQDGTMVSIVTLDEALNNIAPHLLKIDVEGFELFVLKGAEKILQRKELKAIILELNGAGGHYGYRDADVVDLLTHYGFASYVYDPFTRQLTAQKPLPYNVLFIRDLELVKSLVYSSETFQIKTTKL